MCCTSPGTARRTARRETEDEERRQDGRPARTVRRRSAPPERPTQGTEDDAVIPTFHSLPDNTLTTRQRPWRPLPAIPRRSAAAGYRYRLTFYCGLPVKITCISWNSDYDSLLLRIMLPVYWDQNASNRMPSVGLLLLSREKPFPIDDQPPSGTKFAQHSRVVGNETHYLYDAIGLLDTSTLLRPWPGSLSCPEASNSMVALRRVGKPTNESHDDREPPPLYYQYTMSRPNPRPLGTGKTLQSATASRATLETSAKRDPMLSDIQVPRSLKQVRPRSPFERWIVDVLDATSVRTGARRRRVATSICVLFLAGSSLRAQDPPTTCGQKLGSSAQTSVTPPASNHSRRLRYRDPQQSTTRSVPHLDGHKLPAASGDPPPAEIQGIKDVFLADRTKTKTKTNRSEGPTRRLRRASPRAESDYPTISPRCLPHVHGTWSDWTRLSGLGDPAVSAAAGLGRAFAHSQRFLAVAPAGSG
ncbi:hypothetical protein C8Q74DRAFT_1222341 [Fomes fomentarius]|nr:hypothetical protein C8Q74DRAFT_1222341 [Fomes fomentarius]